MTDLSTYAGQAAHYAGVRERLRAMPLSIPASSVHQKLAPVAPKKKPVDVPYGAPINLIGPATVRTIIRLVSLRDGVPYDSLLGPQRSRVIVASRNAAIKLVYTHCSHLSLPQIGRVFGRDHSTIFHSLGMSKKARKLNGNVKPIRWVLPTRQIHSQKTA